MFAAWGEERLAAVDNNPVALLAELSDAELDAKLTPDFARRVARLRDLLHAETVAPSWWQRRFGDRTDFCVAYFSCEFGLDESLPIYSGGLGVLSGDHLKSASDLGIPLVAVGLFYRNGYFRQQLDESGWQTERYPANDPALLPLHEEQVRVSVQLPDDAGTVHDVCAYVSVWGQMGELSKGIVDLRRLVLDATLVALPLFVTVRAVDAWRWG